MNLADKLKKFSAGKKLSISQPINTTTGNKVLLIDGLNAYIRAFAATPTMNEDGDHMGGVTGFLLSVGAMIRLHKPSKVVIVFDGKHGSLKRRALFKDYKANRKFMTKLNRTYDFATIEEEMESREKQFVLLAAIIKNLPVQMIQLDHVEADDVLACLADIYEARGNKVILASTDKDFLQLVNSNISIWNPIKKKMYNPERVAEDYGFHPNNFLLYRTVTGDVSDNIPGVPGIKEKTLLKYFPELAEEAKRDVEFLFEGAEKIVEGSKKPPVALTNLLGARSQLLLNHKLMTLADPSISGHNQGEILQFVDKMPNEYNKSELTKLIRFNKLIHAFGNYEAWLQSTFVPLLRYKLTT